MGTSQSETMINSDGPLLPVTENAPAAPADSSGWAPRKWLINELYKFKTQMMALWYASVDPRVPFVVKFIATIMLALSLSPIEIIPARVDDTGLLQDLVVVPLGVALAIKLIPEQVWEEAHWRAEHGHDGGERPPPNYCAGLLIVSCWLSFAVSSAKAVWKIKHKHRA